jgi:hypothetical protein
MRCRRTSALVLILLGFGLVTSGCTSAEDLYPEARCDDKALTDMKQDAPKIIKLAPENISKVDGRFWEKASRYYQAECNISDGEGNEILRGRTVYYDGEENNPSRSSRKSFFEEKDFEGTPRAVTSSGDAVEGVSGRGSAGVWAPCSMEKSTGLRPGAMVATIAAPSAPDGDSVQQRQNAADLALSLLRHAVKKCDDPPEMPKKVKVTG